MIAPSEITAIVLASGVSQRFGEADKLLHTVCDTPLAMHIMDTLTAIPFMERVVVVATDNMALTEMISRHHFQIAHNPQPLRGQGHSLSLGVKRALERQQPEALLICLADMPCVPVEVIDGLIQALNTGASAAVCSAEGRISPPALFHKQHFPSLVELDGEMGARKLLNTIPDVVRVEADPKDLRDFDVPEDFLRPH